MIRNLDAYNAWKRSTLDRLTAKYRNEYLRVIQRHLTTHRHAIISALDQGSQRVIIPTHDLDQELKRVLEEHQKEAVRVGVSDGIREITPEKKLSTWESWPYWYPVENTFVELAEKTKRDKIFKSAYEKIKEQARFSIAELIDLEKKRYLRNVQTVFQIIAKGYYAEENEQDPKEAYVDLLKRVFQKTNAQAETLFRTETTRYFNEARIDYFKNNTDVDFVQLIAVTDGRISEICESRDGYVIPIDRAQQKQFKPPFHPNCRTVQSPLDTDLSRDADEVRSNLGSEFGTIHSNTSGKEFVGRRKPPEVPLPKGWS